MGNRLGREKTNGFRPRSETLSHHLYIIVWLSYARFDVAYMSTHPPQCSKLLVFSAVSVVQEDITAKVQQLHRVGLTNFWQEILLETLHFQR